MGEDDAPREAHTVGFTRWRGGTLQTGPREGWLWLGVEGALGGDVGEGG